MVHTVQEHSQEISLDELARMIAKGFSETGANFVKVEGRLVKIEDRLDSLDTRMDSLDMRMGNLEKTIHYDHEKRLRKVETKLQIA
jgi:hypothetical protein